MIERAKSFNSSLHNVSKKRLEQMRSGLLPKKKSTLRRMSKSMKQRVKDWRKTARDACTVNGQLYCALCGYPINDEQWDAHHYKQRRGQAHSVANDKYVAALHRHCHTGINHYSSEFDEAREIIENVLKVFKKNQQKDWRGVATIPSFAPLDNTLAYRMRQSMPKIKGE